MQVTALLVCTRTHTHRAQLFLPGTRSLICRRTGFPGVLPRKSAFARGIASRMRLAFQAGGGLPHGHSESTSSNASAPQLPGQQKDSGRMSHPQALGFGGCCTDPLQKWPGSWVPKAPWGVSSVTPCAAEKGSAWRAWAKWTGTAMVQTGASLGLVSSGASAHCISSP